MFAIGEESASDWWPMARRNRGGGAPALDGIGNTYAYGTGNGNGHLAEPRPGGLNVPAFGNQDHQHQVRLLVLRERLRRALYS